KIIALQRAGRKNPVAHENAEDLTANVLVGRSVRHRPNIRFARRRSYDRTATVDNIAQPRSNLAFAACPPPGESGRRADPLGCPLLMLWTASALRRRRP